MLDVDLERPWHGVMGEVWGKPVGPVERLAGRVLRSAATAREAIAAIVEHYQRHPDGLPADYRRRIERDPARPELIKTVRGDGYSFVGQVRR